MQSTGGANNRFNPQRFVERIRENQPLSDDSPK